MYPLNINIILITDRRIEDYLVFMYNDSLKPKLQLESLN